MRWAVLLVFLLAGGCSSDKTNCGALCGDATPSDGAVNADGSLNLDSSVNPDGAVSVDGSVASDASRIDTGTQRGFDAESADALGPFDGGDVMPSTPDCQSVLACCSMVPRDQQPLCYQSADDDDDRACRRLLVTYQRRSWCMLPDAGPADTGPDAGVTFCEALADCCSMRGRNQPRGCAGVVAAGDEKACQSLFVTTEC